jgi:hypothetical protein
MGTYMESNSSMSIYISLLPPSIEGCLSIFEVILERLKPRRKAWENSWGGSPCNG